MDGITTIGQLQHMDTKMLADRYGSIGLRLASLSRGEDVRSVTPNQKAKSISSETTFNSDLHREADLMPLLRRLCEKVSARLKEKDLAGRTIVLKLKTANFKQRTRNVQLADPTQLADRIFRSGRALLARELDGTAFRLIGIGVSDLSDRMVGQPLFAHVTLEKGERSQLADLASELL